MHSRSDQYHWLFEPLRPAFLREDEFVEEFLLLVLLVGLVMRRNGQQMHIPAFWTLGEDLLVEVELIVAVVLVEGVEVFYVFGVGVGVDEGELYLVRLVLEVEVEGALEFPRFPENKRTLGGNARPAGPLIRFALLNLALPIDRPVALGELVLRVIGVT